MTIRITSKQDGFRRCGVAHPAAATSHRDDAFTAVQLVRLQAEPMLIVELLDGEPDGGKSQPPAPVVSKDAKPAAAKPAKPAKPTAGKSRPAASAKPAVKPATETPPAPTPAQQEEETQQQNSEA